MKFRRKADGRAGDGAPRPAADAPRPRRRHRSLRRSDELADDGVERVDLGSLLIAPEPGRELRLQVDEATGEVQSVMLAGPDGALELRRSPPRATATCGATCAPRSPPTSPRRGGTATEREGRFGTELLCQVPVQRPDGTTGHPAVADHRHQRPPLDAARHPARPARRRARGRRRLGGRARPGRRPPRRHAHARRRAAAGRAARRTRAGSTEPTPDSTDPAPQKSRLRRSISAGPTPTTSTPATCAARTPPSPARPRSPTRPTASGSGCAAPCAP